MSAFTAGLGASLRNRRLAGILWLSLLGSALVAAGPIKALFKVLDEGAFREALVKGWDGWAFVSFLVSRGPEIDVALAAVASAFVVFALLQIFLTGGVLRALIGGRPRPVFRLVVAESAGLFKANLWATVRFALAAADLARHPRCRARGASLEARQGRGPAFVPPRARASGGASSAARSSS